LYNALNDRIRNLLLQYDYSKSTDPLQPLAAHTTSLLSRQEPKTSDITVVTYDQEFALHKFVLAARSPYFADKLASQPDITSWKLPPKIPSQSFTSVVRYLYLGEASADLSDDAEEQKAILAGIDKLGKQLQVPALFESIMDAGDRRLARQRRTDEMARGRNHFATWFDANVLRHKVSTNTEKADSVKWDRDNAIFADVLLRADEPADESGDGPQSDHQQLDQSKGVSNGIPVGTFSTEQTSTTAPPRKSVLYPAHRAMLLRSEFFSTMFSSGFREAKETPHLQIIPIDCSPQVLEIVLTYLYTEKADFPLEVAVDVLFAADLLFIEKLKQRAAVIISTLGNGDASIVESENPRGGTDVEDVIDIYDVVRAGWDTRVHRLEEFGARFIAYRLERYIDDPDFAELVRESANRIQGRQETDTVELIDE
jgi:ankyrin repeat/BTB/POZ domain-containing protein 1